MPVFSAIPSKSVAHRLLIGAFLAGSPDAISCDRPSLDIIATGACLRAISSNEILPCGESGSTLRFLLPVVGALGHACTFSLAGRLPQRPLDQTLLDHGMTFSLSGNLLTVSGRLLPGAYRLPGNISSQFITGLLLALPLLDGPSTLTVTGVLESRPYVDLTLDALRQFGIEIGEKNQVFTVKPQKYRCDGPLSVEGCWSSAAFWLCAGAISQSVTVTGLNPASVQGDRQVLDLLARFGARVRTAGDRVTVSPGTLRGFDIDCAAIPDLVPALAVVAAAAEGRTRFYNAGRLRLKESDRIASVLALLHSIGARAEERPDGLVVYGGCPLMGGTVDACGDHRIAMAAAIAGLLCPVEVRGKEAVNKSYPDFWTEYEKF